MGEQMPNYVEMEKSLMAVVIEERIVDGKTEVMNHGERTKLRESIEKRGVDLSLFARGVEERIIEGVGRSSRQAKELEVVLGGEGSFIDYCQKILITVVSDERKDQANGFVEKYIALHTKGGYLHFSGRADRLKDRLEAIVSVTHNLFELMAKEEEDGAVKVMESEEFALSVRERVLRGREMAGMEVSGDREIARRGDKTIRTLPVGGLRKIVDYWLK